MFLIFWGGGSRIIQWPYVHSPWCHAQPTYHISKESIHVCRIHSQYKCASFSCSNSLWRPFWISNFSQNSYIWHVVILGNMLTQYENNRTYSVDTMVIKRQMCHFYSEKWAEKKSLGGNFELRISANLLPYGMSLYLAIGPILWLNFRFSPNSFSDIL